MAQISLSKEKVASISEQLNSTSGQMESLLSEIEVLYNKIGTEGIWSGTAAQSAKEAFAQLSAKFPEFSLAVKDCANYLSTVVIPNFDKWETTIR